LEENRFCMEPRVLARDATKTEFPWLKGPLKRGDVVYTVTNGAFDVGARNNKSVSLSPDGGSFFELPVDMLDPYIEPEDSESEF